jgi:hypothetical protein
MQVFLRITAHGNVPDAHGADIQAAVDALREAVEAAGLPIRADATLTPTEG